MGCSFTHEQQHHYHGRNRWSPARWSPVRWSPTRWSPLRRRRRRSHETNRRRSASGHGAAVDLTPDTVAPDNDGSPATTPRSWSPLPRRPRTTSSASSSGGRWSLVSSFRRHRARGSPPKPPTDGGIVRLDQLRLTYGQRLFVGFAVNTYGQPRFWKPLRNCRSDVETVADRLESLGFRSRVVTDGACTRAGIGRVLDVECADRLGPDDLLVVMLAGHGSPSFFACHDTGGDARLRHDKYTARDLDRLCRDCPARHLLVIVDVCFGGGFAQFCTPPDRGPAMRSAAVGDVTTTRQARPRRVSSGTGRVRPALMVRRDLLGARTRLVLTSGPADTAVPDAAADSKAHSPFTAALLRALPSSPPTSLFGVVSDVVGRLRRDASIATTPMLGRGPTDEGGDVLFGV